MKANRLILLNDNRNLTDEEFCAAQAICRQIQRIKDDRADYVAARGIDPEIAYPAANWDTDANNPIHEAYARVVTGDYDVLNRLRLYSQAFSGYQLASFSDGGDKPLPGTIPPNFDEIIAAQLAEPDFWVRRWKEIITPLPRYMVTHAPAVMGEIGWNVGGYPVSYDVYVAQERLNLLYATGVISRLRGRARRGEQVNIIEIGGGYGALAYYLKGIIPEANYFICDLPESLIFSALYLSTTRPEAPHMIYEGGTPDALAANSSGFKFVPNYIFDDVVKSGLRFDLAINTLSFSEMSAKQVRSYAQGIKTLIGDTGLLFEQNQDNVGVGFIYSKNYLRDYFAFRHTIGPAPLSAACGVADLWANRPIRETLKPWPVAMRNVPLRLQGAYLHYRPRVLEAVKRLVGHKAYGAARARKK